MINHEVAITDSDYGTPDPFDYGAKVAVRVTPPITPGEYFVQDVQGRLPDDFPTTSDGTDVSIHHRLTIPEDATYLLVRLSSTTEGVVSNPAEKERLIGGVVAAITFVVDNPDKLPRNDID